MGSIRKSAPRMVGNDFCPLGGRDGFRWTYVTIVGRLKKKYSLLLGEYTKASLGFQFFVGISFSGSIFG